VVDIRANCGLFACSNGTRRCARAAGEKFAFVEPKLFVIFFHGIFTLLFPSCHFPRYFHCCVDGDGFYTRAAVTAVIWLS